MKLVGISMMRNEADIADLTIRHHLQFGCDQVLIVDNGSTDRTPAILQRLARRDARVTWSSDPGPYRQSEIMTGLAHEAGGLGADWVVPFDADEFWWCRPPTSMKQFLDAAGDVAVFSASVVNFVQSRRQRRPSRRALLRMRMRAIPFSGEDEQEAVATREIGFVEAIYPPKVVFRASTELALATGNHFVVGASGPTAETADLACLHAPLRSASALEAQVESGRRIAQVSSDPSTVWQARRWLELWEDGDFGGEWPANSFAHGALDVYGHRHPVEPDGRLREAVRPILLRHPFR